MWRFFYREAATFIIFLAFSNRKRQKRTAGVTIAVAIRRRVKSISFLQLFFLTLYSFHQRKGWRTARCLFWSPDCQFIRNHLSLCKNLEAWRGFGRLTRRDKRYDFLCRLAKRQEEMLLFGNTLLCFLIFIKTWDFLVKLKCRHWEPIMYFSFRILNRVPKAITP